MVFCPSGGASCPFGWSAFLLGGYPAFLGSPAFLVVSCPFGGAPCPFGMFSCLLGWILPSCGYFAFLVVSCPSGVASSPFGMFSSRLGWYPAFLGLSGSSGRYPAFLEGCPSLWVVSGAFWKASCLSGGYPAFVGVAFWGAFLLMKGNPAFLLDLLPFWGVCPACLMVSWAFYWASCLSGKGISLSGEYPGASLSVWRVSWVLEASCLSEGFPVYLPAICLPAAYLACLQAICATALPAMDSLNEFIEHEVPGVPVTPLASNLRHMHCKHDTGAKAQRHANCKVGIYGLALNPNRRKFGWPPAERQVGGKERWWPNSLGQPTQGLHPTRIYNYGMPPPPHPSGVKVVPS